MLKSFFFILSFFSSATQPQLLPSSFKRRHLLIRARICPHKQPVVLCQRIPINHYGLDAPLRNDARHGVAADLESPKLPGMSPIVLSAAPSTVIGGGGRQFSPQINPWRVFICLLSVFRDGQRFNPRGIQCTVVPNQVAVKSKR